MDTAIEDLVCGDSDPADLAYTLHRIERYYEPGEVAVSLAVLDALASRDGPIPLAEVVNLARHGVPDASERAARAACTLLHQDHCIARSSEGLDFRWAITKRWWKANRL